MQNAEFDWSETLQGHILGAFYYGYVFAQIPGGILAQKYGGKHVFGIGIFATAVLTLLTPLAARTGPAYMIAVRVLEGIGEVSIPTDLIFIGKTIRFVLPFSKQRQNVKTMWLNGYCSSRFSENKKY